MTSHLATIVSNAVTESLAATLSRTTARTAEALAEELLKDPEFRTEMPALIRVAFHRALTDLATDGDHS